MRRGRAEVVNPYGALPGAGFSPELLGLVNQGRVISLAYPIEEDAPRGATTSSFTLRAHHKHEEWVVDGPFGEATEIMTLSGHTGTHIDALCHISERVLGDRLLYGDFRVSDAESERGFTHLGIEQCPPVIARGLVVDVARSLDVGVLADSYGITVADIELSCHKQGLDIRAGDCVFIRTGFAAYRDSEAVRFSTVGAGPTPEACVWLAEKGVILTGSDTVSFEQVPSPHEGHLELMRRRGIPIIKQMNLEAIAAEGVSEFLFTMLPLRLVGSTASPVNPVAIY